MQTQQFSQAIWWPIIILIIPIRVVIPSDGSLLDGFVISDRYANYNYSNGQGHGAGLWGDSVSFTVNDCNLPVIQPGLVVLEFTS